MSQAASQLPRYVIRQMERALAVAENRAEKARVRADQLRDAITRLSVSGNGSDPANDNRDTTGDSV